MKKFVLAGLLPAILGGCASAIPPEVTSFRSPVETHVGIRDTHHHNVIGAYEHRVPVNPKPWRQLNDDRSPVRGHGS